MGSILERKSSDRTRICTKFVFLWTNATPFAIHKQESMSNRCSLSMPHHLAMKFTYPWTNATTFAILYVWRLTDKCRTYSLHIISLAEKLQTCCVVTFTWSLLSLHKSMHEICISCTPMACKTFAEILYLVYKCHTILAMKFTYPWANATPFAIYKVWWLSGKYCTKFVQKFIVLVDKCHTILEIFYNNLWSCGQIPRHICMAICL